MKTAINITGIAFSIIFGIVILYYIGLVHDARMESLFSSINSYSSSPYSTYTPYSSSSDSASSLTEEGGLICLAFFLFFLFTNIFNLIKVKTKTNKVISIIGLSLTGIFTLWNLLMITDSGALSFDEVGVAFLLYCFVLLAFAIISTVQCSVHSKKVASGE